MSADTSSTPASRAGSGPSVWNTNHAIAWLAMVLPVAGVVAILIYTGFRSTFGIGLLAALGAAAIGMLVGLLFGVPRAISSGQARQQASVKEAQRQAAVSLGVSSDVMKEHGIDSAQDPSGAQRTALYTPSTNLAEVSDWLTKLLLGASLVSLTKLGGPLGKMIDSIAGGLSYAGTTTESAKVVAGFIVFGYFALGFLDGYILTTLWYQKQLDS